MCPKKKRRIIDTGKHLPKATVSRRMLYPMSREALTRPTVLKHVKGKRGMIHGARAMNLQMPINYRRGTEDWDTYTNRAEYCAVSIERDLDNIFGSNMFYVTVFSTGRYEARKLVYRVVSRGDRKPVADVVFKADMPPSIVVDGVKYATLKYLKGRQERILRTPRFRFRWAQAQDDLVRITRAMEDISWRKGMGGIIAGLIR